MGIAGPPDIFQAKMSELVVALKFVKTYLDDLLCITWASLDDHIEKLREVLTRLREVGRKVNARKSKFCAKETEYLGYVLTTDGIKPQQQKRYRQSSHSHHQLESKTSVGSLAWSITTEIFGQSTVTCLPHSPLW